MKSIPVRKKDLHNIIREPMCCGCGKLIHRRNAFTIQSINSFFYGFTCKDIPSGEDYIFLCKQCSTQKKRKINYFYEVYL